MANRKTIEDNFQSLEEVLKEMQSEDVTLDKSFDLYNKGLKLIQDCNNKIEKIEKDIEIINSNNIKKEANE